MISNVRVLKLTLPVLAAATMATMAVLALPARAADPDVYLNAPGAGSPDIAVSSDGTFVALVYFKNTGSSGSVYLKSAEASKGWRTRPNALGSTQTPPKVVFSPTSPNTVYAVWQDGVSRQAIRYALCSLSSSAVPSCPTIGTVYSGTDELRSPDLAIDSSGNFHLAWENVDEERIETLYLPTLSGLPAITPTDTVAPPPSSGDRFTDPALAVSASHVHLTFSRGDIPTTVEFDPQAIEIYRSSLTGAHNWSSQKSYAIGNISTAFKKVTSPAIAANGARVFAVWNGYTTGKFFSLMGAESTDNGGTWPTSPHYITSTKLAVIAPNDAFNERLVSSPGGSPFQEEGLRPSLTISDTDFALVWQQRPTDSDNCDPNDEGSANGTSEIYLYQDMTSWSAVKHQTPGDFDSYVVAPNVVIDPNTGEYHLAYMKASPVGDDCTTGTAAGDYDIYYQGPFTIIANDEGESCCVFLPVIFKN